MNRLPLKSVSVIEALAESLRDRALSGDLAPGTPLPEVQLAQQYGVARPTIRAAIQQLALTGLLRREANRSAFVPRLSDDEIRDLYCVRTLLEIEVVRRVTERRFRPPRAEGALLRLEQFGQQVSWSDVVEADLEFHLALVEAADSPHIARLYAMLADQIRLCLAQLRPVYESVKGLAREHRELLAAIESGDVAHATSYMQQHLGQAVNDLTHPGPSGRPVRHARQTTKRTGRRA